MTAAGESGSEQWATQPTLAVWAYDSPMGAAAGFVRLHELQRRGAVSVGDVVTVTWVNGTHRPRIGHLRAHRAYRGRSSYSVLGALADVLTFGPGPGRSGQDPVVLLAGLVTGTGLNEEVLRTVRASITPGRSVMLVLSTGADPAAALPAIQRGLDRGDVTLAHTVLAVDAERTLRHAIETVLLDVARPVANPAS